MAGSILNIPSDILILIMRELTVSDLANLSASCKALHSLVEEFGWSCCLRRHPRPSKSLERSAEQWSPSTRIRINTIIDRNYDDQEFIARPLSNRWVGKLQPILAINSSRLLLAARNLIYSYAFIPSSDPEVAPPVQLDCIYTTSSISDPSRDITSVACIPDDGLDRTVVVGYANGIVEQLFLPPSSTTGATSEAVHVKERQELHGTDIVESISTSKRHVLSLSSSGVAAFSPLSSISKHHHTHHHHQILQFNSRSWATYLSPSSTSTPYAAFGTSSKQPLGVHHILPSKLSTQPYVYLGPSSKPEHVHSSAVYAIDSAPPSAPWGSSDQIIVSGWFDGLVRVHDLRSSSRLLSSPSSSPSSQTTSVLLPTMSFADPWSFEPIYSLSTGGGSSSHIVAGTARHSILSFWDIRMPAKGWSVHAPGNDSSPVYSVILDGPRVFGANESRGFVLDFGVGVREDTYPPINVNRGGGGGRAVGGGRGWRQSLPTPELKRKSPGSPGFYVTKYAHDRGVY
ncbi:hypothetical protein C8Q75DRAFT_806946 [Abortiporus biennis]|nr:hypothetical protein C8Q75DRAFT_806946 [Abortiporus biennis]